MFFGAKGSQKFGGARLALGRRGAVQGDISHLVICGQGRIAVLASMREAFSPSSSNGIFKNKLFI